MSKRTDVRDHVGAKYLKNIRPAFGGGPPFQVDVYCVLDAYGVACPAVGHAVKKLLCTGTRGKGDILQDLHEALDAVNRAIDLQEGRVGGAQKGDVGVKTP